MKLCKSLAALLMVVCLLAGCTQPVPAATTPSASGAAATESAKSAAESTQPAETSAAPAEEKVLRIDGFNWGWDSPIAEQDLVGPEIAKKMGFKVDFAQARVGSYEEVEKRLQMWAASGMTDWPAIIFTGCSSITRDICNRMGAGGKLMDWKTIMNKIPNTANAAAAAIPLMETPEGKLYMFPQNWQDIKAYKADAGYYIRKDWLDQVNLPYPKTIQELDTAFYAFKDKIKVDGGVIPYMAFGETFQHQFNWFIPNDKNGWQFVNGQAVNMTYEEPSYLVNAIRWYNKWYNDGIIDPEAFTLKEGQISEKANANRIGFIHGAWWQVTPYTDNLQKTIPEAQYVTPSLLYDATVMDKPNDMTVSLDMWASYSLRADIDPELLDMFEKFLEFSMSEDRFMLEWWGVKDKHWEFNADNKVVDTKDCADRLKGDWNARVHEGIQWYTGISNYDLIVKFTAPSTFDLRPDMIACWKNIGTEYPVAYISNPNNYITPGPIEMQNTIGFSERYKQMVHKAVTGKAEDVEKTVLDWVAAEKAMGYDQIKAERTELCKKIHMNFNK